LVTEIPVNGTVNGNGNEKIMENKNKTEKTVKMKLKFKNISQVKSHWHAVPVA